MRSSIEKYKVIYFIKNTKSLGMYTMFIIAFAALENEQERKKLQDFYEENEKKIFNFAMKYAGDQEIAEEAIQNAFVYIIQNKEKYLELSCRDLLNSIVIIVKSRCKDIFKRKKLNLERFVEKDIEDIENLDITYERAIDDDIIMAYEYELIRKYMKLIDETSRLILEMKYIEGRTYKEIGVELGMTTKHVDTKIMRAKEKVRKLVEKELNYCG